MKKIMNKPENFANETLEGILRAHPNDLRAVGDDVRELVRADAPVQGKVAIATGGGSGHLPVFLGYVGKGMLDGVAVGDVFNSPSAQQMFNVTKAIHGGKGVLYLYGNYGGDVMNFDMAAEMAEMEDIRVETVLVADDVASAPKGEEHRRRGVAGLFFAYKIAGAKADEGADLDEVVAVTKRALANIRSMGVALSPCIIPRVGKPTFTIGEDEMEIGMGIHGEPGITRGKLKTADEIAETLLEAILNDGPYESGDEVAVLVNGLGATPQEELYIVYRRAHEILQEKGLKVFHVYVGEFATSMEMAGMSLTVFKLDEELKRLLKAPAYTPFFAQPQL
ncbi:dihydroxyacetone kinase subunit DhaK [Candidatus Darwinibacter acetoxidans]|nr:dihydroxyacetone kinase subunit DhaK [Bacillota bacterium]HPT82759.1 dihydroxyacetone kinase subunit DhaK [Limnochordia bacterium]